MIAGTAVEVFPSISASAPLALRPVIGSSLVLATVIALARCRPIQADAYAVVIAIVSALLCALGAVVVAVSRGEAHAPLVCWLITISGLLCRSVLPLPGTRATIILGRARLEPRADPASSPPSPHGAESKSS